MSAKKPELWHVVIVALVAVWLFAVVYQYANQDHTPMPPTDYQPTYCDYYTGEGC